MRSTIELDLNEVPAVVLVGPRQVGKTTLARAVGAVRPSIYLDMERPADRNRLSDADAYLRGQSGRLVIIDEIQRVPELFPILRGIIDERRAAGGRTGHFLLLGSASLALLEHSGESLAGRIRVRELDGIDITEASDASSLWLRGGFPESLLAPSDTASMRWREDLIASYLARDVPMFAPRLPPATIERLWTMLAHAQGGVVNRSRFAESLGVSSNAVGRYLDLLSDLYLVRLLQPWSANVGKRLVKSPKVYVRDSGLLHALLGLTTPDDVLGHPVAGPSYEGWVIEQLLGVQTQAVPFFYRTHAGAEVDLVLTRGGRVQTLIEIKRSTSPKQTRGLRSAIEDLKPDASFVVYPGSERYPLGDHVEVIGLHELVALL